MTEAREDPLCSQDKVDAGAPPPSPSPPPLPRRTARSSHRSTHLSALGPSRVSLICGTPPLPTPPNDSPAFLRACAGYCAIELDNTYKPKAIALCVTPETGVQDCHDACVADQTCGAFSVTVNQGYDGGEEFGCLENKNSYCLMYPRVDYDGNVLAWDKANGGDVNYVNFRSFALDAREVTCMDCRTSDVR